MNRSFRDGMLIAVSIIALFSQTLAFDFTYDDHLAIVQNEVVTDRSSSLLRVFQEPYRPGRLYRPITTLTYRINYALFGEEALSFHAINLLLHLFAALLVYRLMTSILESNKAALIVALLFAIHPLQVETVSGIVGRAELLSLCFGMLSLFAFKAGLERDRTGLFVLSALLFFFATLSKESAFVFIVLIPLYPLFIVGGSLLRSVVIRTVLFLLPVVVVSLVFRQTVLGGNFLVRFAPDAFVAANPLYNEQFFARLFPAIQILGKYINLLFFPLRLSADYSLPHDEFWMSVFSFSGFLNAFVFLLFLFLCWLFRRERWVFAGLWFLVAFSLTSNILLPIGTIMGERLVYLPSIGFFGFLGGIFLSLERKEDRRVQIVFLWTLILALFFVRAFLRVPIWRNNSELFSKTVLDAPLSPKAHFNYGIHLYQEEGNLDESERYFRQAFSLMPTNPDPAKFLIDISLERKEYARAEYWCRKVLGLNPDDESVAKKLSTLLHFKEAGQQGS